MKRIIPLLIWSADHFHCYLHGSRFSVFTDHSALKWLLTTKDCRGRIARWVSYLMDFDFDVHFRPGTNQQHVDSLSRVFVCDVGPLREEESHFETDVWKDGPLNYYVTHGKHMTGVSRKTKNRVVRLAELYVLEAGKFYFKPKENLLLIPSPEERGSLIVDAHLYGHCGMHSVFKRLKGKYFWKGMVKDIGRIVRSCGICQQFNRESIVTDSPSKPILVCGIFEKVGMDLVLGFPETKDGFVGCLVLTEYLSKFPMVYPVRSKNAEEIAAHLLDYVSLFGAPREIISDQGTEFINLVVDKMLTGFGIVHAHTTAYNPAQMGLQKGSIKPWCPCSKSIR